MTTNGTHAHQRSVIGNDKSFWLYSSQTGFDLTHPPTPTSPPITPSVTIQTTTKPITIDPTKSALVIIDMQRFFLSSAFGRAKGAGHAALDQLVQNAIPAARKAGIRVVWLNWGLTDEEVRDMPPAITRAFGFDVMADEGDCKVPVDKQGNAIHQGGDKILENGKKGKKYSGLGKECGMVEVGGEQVDAGKLLSRGAWNSELEPPLDGLYEEGKNLETRPDVWIHKNRMSGMWGATTPCHDFLQEQGITTLFFTGVNTDQCVGGTLTDSFSKGYDCIFLDDGAGTTSPHFAQQCFQYNSANTFGFSTTCRAMAEGVGL